MLDVDCSSAALPRASLSFLTQSAFTKAIVSLFCLGAAVAGRGDPIIKAEKLGTFHPGVSNYNTALMTSPDGEHYGFMGGDGSRENMIIDGIAGPLYTQVGRQLVRVYQKDYSVRRPGLPFQYRPKDAPIRFTGKGDEAVYVANQGGTTQLIVASNGIHREWPTNGRLTMAAVSDGGNFIYGVYQENQSYQLGGPSMTLVINETPSPADVFPMTQPNTMAFHEPDEGQPAYAYIGRIQKMVNNRRQDEHRVFINGVPGPAYLNIETQLHPLCFATVDGKLAAVYSAQKAGERDKRAVIQFLDGTVIESQGALIANSLRVTEEANGVAWLESPIQTDPRQNRYNNPDPITVSVVVNGQTAFDYQADQNESRQTARYFQLSPDGSRWAAARYLQGGNGAVWHVIVDGIMGPEYPMIENPEFSASGEHFYYVARNGRNAFLVFDGMEYGPYSNVSQIVSSDSGQSIAWFGQGQYESGIYVNGMLKTPTESYGPQTALKFHPGTEDLIYTNQAQNQLQLQVGEQSFPIHGRQQGEPVISSDASRAALVGQFHAHGEQPGSQLWIDGENISLGEDALTVDPAFWMGFSPDNKHFAAFGHLRDFSPERRNAGTLIVDGYHLEPLLDLQFRDLINPRFTDENNLQFYASFDQEIIRYTVDLDAAQAYGKARAEAQQKGGGTSLFALDPQTKVTQFDHVWLRDGDLIYGVASGGEYGQGALYRLNGDGSDFQILHHFIGGGQHARQASSLVLADDGYLYGTAGDNSFFAEQPRVAGAIFRIRTDGTGYEIVSKYPYDSKTRTSPKLYGIAPNGDLLAIGPVPNPGRSGTDGLLKIDRSSGEIETVYRANEYPEDAQPIFKTLVPFIDGKDGYYYGWDQRSLYRFTLDGNAPEKLYQLKGFPLDGDSITDGPILFGDWLYGLTHGGGKNRLGVVYRLKRDGSNYEVIRHMEADRKFVALTANESGVWGYRTEPQTVQHRRTNVPALERLDQDGGEPRVLENTRLSDRIWFGELAGEPTLFALTAKELIAVSMDEKSTTPPELTKEVIAMPELKAGTSATASF
ncbi:choice-of-anchor tandem repeat GloVer-containing protein [Pelagicoccus sp. SDUM812003]|uniref:choice-of-anchor tandem repeat GloVer-containing protein n=1 Tax=Pelagicoccus sp. SDUM812003 TaxID=3041267 RepID=UPI00281022B3|nr:choice-of-anchor tandem repeat GloVer-containing protein [Pelagicoccus sp. SDUM812003]MDQ8202870.1 hypothetical protein [Pelagicoccus sp. SDUM812003]